MEISTSQTQDTTVGVEALKKAIDVKEQQVLKVLEGATEQSQQMSAQKTGLGTQLNISG